MFRRSPRHPLSFDDYLDVLHQLQRIRRRGDQDWSPHLAHARKIGVAMTSEQRLAPEGLGQSEMEHLAASSDLRLWEIEQVLSQFREAREVAEAYQDSGLWERLKRLIEADPFVSWLRDQTSTRSRRGDAP